MDIKIDITPEVIQQQITDSIIKAGIGESMRSAVMKAIHGYSFNNSVDEAIKQTVARMVQDELIKNDGLKFIIREKITETITQEHISTLVTKMFEILNDRY